MSLQFGERGVALILVLVVMVLLSVLVLSFFTSVSADRIHSEHAANSAAARRLADTAVNLVISQIREATTSDGGTLLWVSQPGAIRTFSTEGEPAEIYRLYSSASPVASGSTFDPFQEATDLLDWRDRMAHFTDLNAPVLEVDAAGPIVAGGARFRPVYPILNPSAAGRVEGFEILNTPGTVAAEYAGSYPPASDYNPVENPNPAPMPVAWTYILRDGTLVAPRGAGTDTAEVPDAGKSNPIIGRIAYWTDDETAKVNINTASEGRFWDVPRYTTADANDPALLVPGSDTEAAYAKYQPAAGEYNRYPGHPATTSLSRVLGNSLTARQIFGLLPRTLWGGSEMGTIPASTALLPPDEPGRLFATMDEFIFQEDRSRNVPLSREDIEALRFFLTSSSRAPETNVFNRPRISIWPVQAVPDPNSSPLLTPLDRVLAFCARINGLPYYFQRLSPRSATVDFQAIQRNQDIFGYLRNLSEQPVPGYGGTFQEKYGRGEMDQILTQFFDYIRSTNLRDSRLPEADRFARAQSSGTNQGGMVRSPGEGEVVPIRITHPEGHTTMGFGRFPAISEVAIWFVALGQGENTINPSTPPSALDADEPVHPQQPFRDVPAVAGRTPPPNTTAVMAIFLLNFVSPAQGWSNYNPGFTVRVKGLENWTLNSEPLQFPAASSSGPSVFVQDANFHDARPLGGPLGLPAALAFKDLDRADTDPDRYPLYSTILYLPNRSADGADLPMHFGGGAIEVEIFGGNTTTFSATAQESPDFIQSYRLDIPDGSFPMPKIPTVASQFDRRRMVIGSSAANFEIDPATLSIAEVASNTTHRDRLDWVTDSRTGSHYRIISGGNSDVVRGYGLEHGDFRLLFRPEVVDGVNIQFRPYGDWNDSGSPRLTYSFYAGAGPNNPTQASKGNLIPNVVVSGSISQRPLIPGHLNGVGLGGGNPSGLRGDWDNGVGALADGPFINKPDEGTVASQADDVPYFTRQNEYVELGPALFSPNRQVPSPVVFGSLPSGLIAGRPWQNLLFRPAPTSETEPLGHPGQAGRGGDGTLLDGAPPDHMLLDWFWMPIVEPYAISEPFSTAGKVNLNVGILPFSNYLRRETALLAVMHAERVARVSGTNYKQGTGNLQRLPLNMSPFDGALRQFRERFNEGGVFLSPTEICEIFLPPVDTPWATDTIARSQWYSSTASAVASPFRFVGNNLRERPYAGIYPRLTTKSNTFTVHYKVQVLKQVSSAPDGVWSESTGTVTSELRGSTTIERYIDPNDPAIPDFTEEFDATLDPYYSIRILKAGRFPR